MRKYYSYLVKKVINVKKLVTIEYLNVSNDFNYDKEKHTFYEFVYVDSGSLHCITENGKFLISQGDFFFIPPNTIHHYESNQTDPTRIFIVCFECNGDLLELLEGKTKLTTEEKSIISMAFSEAKKAFVFPFDKKLQLLESPVFGAQQLAENHIEHLLITLIRKKLNDHQEIVFVLSSAEISNNLANDIIQILRNNIYGKITLKEIQDSLYYSKTFLNTNFKKSTGESIMQYYRILKIEEAKKLLKNGEAVTTVAYKLCFDSPNYFSRVFHSVTGLTPTQFKKTI